MNYNRLLRFRSLLDGALRPPRCAAIAAALAVSVGGQASADVKLINASYVDFIDSSVIGYRDVTPSIPTSPVINPVPLPSLLQTTGGGTISGTYRLRASNTADYVVDNVTVKAARDSEADAFFQLTAGTSYQVVVIVRPGKSPPPSIKAVPNVLTVKGNVFCANKNSYADARFTFLGGDLAPLIFPSAFCNDPSGLPDQPKFTWSTKLGLAVGEPDSITRGATIDTALVAFDGHTAQTSATAVIDPEIEIDPSFAYADDFELVFSPGYAPSAVPEPATWTLLAAGFISLHLVRQRMKNRVGKLVGMLSIRDADERMRRNDVHAGVNVGRPHWPIP